jgi:hypothetical protein
MNELLPILLASTAGAGLALACSTGLSRQERKWVAISFVMHVGFACAQVPIAYGFYGGSDMFLYTSYGEILARLMDRDASRVIPEVTALLLHRQHGLPMWIIGAGTSTGTMSALAAWTFYLLGPSKYAACIVFAMLSLCGKIAMYRVFRANVQPGSRLLVAVATLLIPSFVFWSAGLIKEAVAIAGFGWALLGVHLWITQNRPGLGALLVFAGSVPVLLVKAYILFPFALAAGSWFYWSRSLRRGRVRIRPAYLALAGVMGFGGIVLLAHYFPQYSPDTFSERAYDLQHIGRGMRGGSNYALSGEVPNTLTGQLAYAPVALLAALFRPAIFEVNNVLMLANALETAVLTILMARIFFTRSLSGIRRQIAEDPFLLFCCVFVVSFGIAVGLTSTNLGTLSRYRSPILPFFAFLLFSLGRRPRESSLRADARSGTRSALGPA